MMNLLDSHDTDRFYTWVGRDRKKLLSAAAVMVMFVGAPCIYYGTETLLEGGYDPDNRRCFDWNESSWDMYCMEKIKALLALRKEKAVQTGGIRVYSREGLFVLKRFLEEEELILYCNRTKEALSLAPEGDTAVENGFADGCIDAEGFVIFRRRGCLEADASEGRKG